MKTDSFQKKYPLDNSGMVYLATCSRRYSNTFRLSLTLDCPVRPEFLQQAFEAAAPAFPMVAAGIRKGVLQYSLVPAGRLPEVRLDRQLLACMTPEEIRSCALRVLYGGHCIAVEIFHSLTDGYGGMQFLTALTEKYLELFCGSGSRKQADPRPFSPWREATAWENSYAVYAGRRMGWYNGKPSYLLPGKDDRDRTIHITTAVFPARKLLETAHSFRTKLTPFLVALFSEAVMDVQRERSSGKISEKPVQIMIPADLRKRYASRSLRNFSLYAYSRISGGDAALPFGSLAQLVSRQIDAQLSDSRLRSLMATNVSLEKLSRFVPLAVKCAGIRLGFHLYGEKNSALTVSNLGSADLPEALRPHVRRMDAVLTPRILSPYNCGVITCGNFLYLNITRRCREPSLERHFFRRISAMGCAPEIEIDGKPADLEKFLRNGRAPAGIFPSSSCTLLGNVIP